MNRSPIQVHFSVKAFRKQLYLLLAVLFLLSNIPFTVGAGVRDAAPSEASAVASRTAGNSRVSPEPNHWDSTSLFKKCDDDPPAPTGPASLSVNKLTNGADGLNLLVLSPVSWSYSVTNTGSVPVFAITVTDSDPLIGFVALIPVIAPQETVTVFRFGLAVAGTYSNTGTAAVSILRVFP
jgi:hypothetical protein